MAVYLSSEEIVSFVRPGFTPGKAHIDIGGAKELGFSRPQDDNGTYIVQEKFPKKIAGKQFVIDGEAVKVSSPAELKNELLKATKAKGFKRALANIEPISPSTLKAQIITISIEEALDSSEFLDFIKSNFLHGKVSAVKLMKWGLGCIGRICQMCTSKCHGRGTSGEENIENSNGDKEQFAQKILGFVRKTCETITGRMIIVCEHLKSEKPKILEIHTLTNKDKDLFAVVGNKDCTETMAALDKQEV